MTLFGKATLLCPFVYVQQRGTEKGRFTSLLKYPAFEELKDESEFERYGVDGFRESNFGLSFIIRNLPNGGVKKARRFIMNRDGFTLLAMGFTGNPALDLGKSTKLIRLCKVYSKLR